MIQHKSCLNANKKIIGEEFMGEGKDRPSLSPIPVAYECVFVYMYIC